MTGITNSFNIVENISISVVFGLLVVFSTRIFTIILSLFVLSALIFQGAHSVFYAGWIDPVNLYLFFENKSEVMRIISDVSYSVLFRSILFIIISFIGMFYVYIYAKKVNGKYWVNAIVILLFIFQPVRDGLFKPDKIEKRFTKDTHSLVRSFHNTYSVFMSILLSDATGNKLYADYRVSPYDTVSGDRPLRPNIFVYFGESLSSKYMGIFSYETNTTPLIDSLSNDPGLFVLAKEAVAGAVATMPSSVRFFHLIEKPDARKQAASFETSLFKYASQQGYRNIYISTQAEDYINHIYKLVAGNYADEYLVPTIIDPSYDDKTFSDDTLVFKALDDLNLDDQFFMVFQPNGSHTPFSVRTTEVFKPFGIDSEVSEYENSVYYTDYIIKSLIDKISSASGDRPWVFVITSDHGTYVDDVRITRSIDFPASFMVPGIVVTNSEEIYQSQIEYLQKCQYIFHENMSKMLGRMMGYDIPKSDCNSGVLFSGLLNGFGSKTVKIAQGTGVELTPYIE